MSDNWEFEFCGISVFHLISIKLTFIFHISVQSNFDIFFHHSIHFNELNCNIMMVALSLL